MENNIPLKKLFLMLPFAILVLVVTGWKTGTGGWITGTQKTYTILYTSADEKNLSEYKNLIASGIKSVIAFFQASFNQKFSVYIHPARQSLDSAWQKDWAMPDFKSECWMVASGVSTKLDMISPKLWDKLSYGTNTSGCFCRCPAYCFLFFLVPVMILISLSVL